MDYPDIQLDIKEYLEENYSIHENTTNMIVFYSCPKCGKENKLYINQENGLFKCHYARCELHQGGNFPKFLHLVEEMSYKDANKLVYDNELSIFKQKKTLLDKLADKKAKEIKERVEIPKMLTDLTKENNPKGWDYLINNRGLSEEDINKLKLQTISNQNFFSLRNEMRDLKFTKDDINYSSQFINRVIFPLWIEGEMKGFMARDITGKDNVKTKNTRGNFRSFYFWNYDNVKDSEEVVLCEGVFDAIKCGVNRSIAFLGTAFTEKQKELLKKTKAKKIIMCLDPGTDSVQEKIYDTLFIDYLNSIYVVNLPPILKDKNLPVINKNFIEKVELLGNTKIKNSGKDWIEIDPQAREYLKKNAKDNLIKIDDPILRSNFTKFFINSEFKDSGDYTKEEMNNFINKAQLYKK